MAIATVWAIATIATHTMLILKAEINIPNINHQRK